MNIFFKDFKKRNRFVPIIIICFLVAGLTGCKIEVYSDPSIQGDTGPTITATGPVVTPVYADSEVTPTPDVNFYKGPDIKTFVPLKENFINYNFDVVRTGTAEEPISFSVQGQYDFNQDGKLDKIAMSLPAVYGENNKVQTYVEVNGIKKELHMSSTRDGEVRIVDLDSRDKFLEIAVFDEGPSYDPNYIFYRYDGKDLSKIGNIDDKALIDKKGNLISSAYLSKFSPAFYSAWYEIDNNEFYIKFNDIESYLGKDYTFDGEEAYFVLSNKIIDPSKMPWSEPKTIPASKIKIIDISFYPNNRTLNFYFVEFPNGDKGMLYFWMGD